jgi:hypothetical protein
MNKSKSLILPYNGILKGGGFLQVIMNAAPI